MKRVIIAGGGASGLAAAIAAADHGASVTVLERLPRVGKKILLTGNGRCNLSHTPTDPAHYHGTLPFARQILAQFDASAYFAGFGLYTRTDSEGRMYPASGTAASVLDALRFAAEQRGVQILCDRQVTDLQQKSGKWRVLCGQDVFTADAVILAAGGSAAPACGTDGSLFPVLRRMRYTVTEPRPALCPVPTDPALVKAMKGMRVKAAASAVLDGRILKTETGEVQFTEKALSGICIFNLSRLAAMHGKKLTVSLDLLPEYDAAAVRGMLRDLMQIRGTLPAGDLLTGLLPKRVAETLLKQAGIRPSDSAGSISQDQCSRLSALLRDWRFPVTGTAGFAQAQVTAGGVAGQCISRTLESKLHDGLYFCGEAVDLDGDCGGYNLAWAWASGSHAGKHAAQHGKNEPHKTK